MELIWNHSDNSLNPSIVARETDCRSDINEPISSAVFHEKPHSSITTGLPVHIVNRPIGYLLNHNLHKTLIGTICLVIHT